MYKKLFKEYFKEVLLYRGRHIYDTEHSVAEFKRHFPHLSINIYEKALQQGVDIILDLLKDSREQFIIKSKKYGFGIQLDWRPDTHNKNNKLKIIR